MKSPTLPRRRDMLALFATCFLPALPRPQGPTIEVRPVGAIDRVKVRLTGGPPGTSPLLTEVRHVLRPALTAQGNASLLPRVRQTLGERYGSQLSESTSAVTYVWVWNGDHWVLVCLGVSTFEIDFGVRGVVQVDVEDGTPMH